MKVGFTGTQRGMTDEQYKTFLWDVLDFVPGTEFHHGGCIGSDSMAHFCAEDLGLHIVIHPPVNISKQANKIGNESRPRLPYLDRNKNIVNETDMLIATPGEKEEQLRSGTWSTVRYARKLGKPITIVFPDGSLKKETPDPNLFG